MSMPSDRLKKLRWRCRRGMRELDVTLLAFLEASFGGLSAAQQQRFEGLLDATDVELYAWLTGRMPHDDAETRVLIGRIVADHQARLTAHDH